MAITGIPTFEDGEIPSAGKLNQLGVAITTKFAGAVEPGDFTWPFVVQGNIDFDDTYGIVNLKTFWNTFNAAEYATLQAAINAAGAANGGAVIIPPGEIVADGVSIENSNIAIIGYGKKSSIRLTTSASSGHMFRSGTASLENIGFYNLLLNGAGQGTGQKGVIMRRVAGFQAIGVIFSNFSGAALDFTNGGTPGEASTDAQVVACQFRNGSSSHIIASDVDGLLISNTKSYTAGATAIALEPGAANGLIKRVQFSNVQVTSPTGSGISVLGGSATADAKWSQIYATNCLVTGASAAAYIWGTTSKLLLDAGLTGCHAPQATTDGIRAAIQAGAIIGCHLRASSGDGIDIQNSVDLWVTGNNCKDAGAYGVNASTTTDCEVTNNNCRDAVTGAVNKASSTGLRSHNNIGAYDPSSSVIFSEQTSYNRTSAGTFTSFSLPANTVHVGDVVRIRVHFTTASVASPWKITIGGTSITGDVNHNGDSMALIEFRVTQTPSNIRTSGFVWRDTANDMVSLNVTSAVLDWTAANTVAVEQASGTDSVSLIFWSVELLGINSN